MGMTEQEDRLAAEREEIAARVASFKATQEKFERERAQYFVTTLQNARLQNPRRGLQRPPFWS
jgi:hypothetical protein